MKDTENKYASERYLLKGMAVSDGVGIGLIHIFHHENYILNYTHIGEAIIKQQILKLDEAIIKTIKEVTTLKDQLKNRLQEKEKLILNIYRNILEDEYFIEEVKNIIKLQKLYAEYAVDIGFNNCIDMIDESNNEYAKQRIYDLNDLKIRLIKNIVGGSEPQLDRIGHKHIVAVREITPTLAAALGKKRVVGILSNEGGAYFSHAAIILRGLGIPLINDVNFENIEKYKDVQAIIDGHEGMLIINPEISEIDRFKKVLKSSIKNRKDLLKTRKIITKTRDGQIIKIFANVGSIEECTQAKNKNIDGIGLVRTEILFAANRNLPDEKEQFLSYLKIVKKMRNKPVVFRTIDFGGDKIFGSASEKFTFIDNNLRGIKSSLLNKEDLNIQIRSVLQAAQYGDVSITFPMVNNAEEIKEVKLLIRKNILEFKKFSVNTYTELKVGAFIETREAIENLDAILKEVSFINIGTNDLFQEIMGSNRLNSSSRDYEYFEPEFLKILKFCINRAKKKGKNTIVCGEMAADPLAAVLLIGMGAYELSMPPTKTADIKAVINVLNLKQLKKLCDRVARCFSAIEVKEIVSKWIIETGRDENV